MNRRTSLSAGLAIFEALSPLSDRVTKIFPLVTDTAELPYICYRRASGEFQQTNSGPRDEVAVEVFCFAATYAGSVDLAEDVRDALDGIRGASECGLTIGSCRLAGGEELWEDDAFIQKLIFNIKI